jgi:hypothetical protein
LVFFFFKSVNKIEKATKQYIFSAAGYKLKIKLGINSFNIKKSLFNMSDEKIALCSKIFDLKYNLSK